MKMLALAKPREDAGANHHHHHHEGVNHDHVPEKPASSPITSPPTNQTRKSGKSWTGCNESQNLQGRNPKAMIDKYK